MALGLLTSHSSFGQAIDTTLWVANGRVSAIVSDGQKIYIGGEFTQVGPATGSGVPIDRTSGALPPGFPRVIGTVNAVASDGAGGWYIAGLFSRVGGLARNNIARVASDLSVSPWNPGVSGLVYSLAVSGSTVYVGGAFNFAGGQLRNRIAAIDAATGDATSWNPNVSAGSSAEVRALAVSGTTVYVGGTFNTIAGQTRNNLAAIDATTGSATSWDPNIGSGASFGVRALAVHGATVYVGGFFTTVGGQTRNNLAALDTTTGAPTTWNPNASARVLTLVVSGSTVYAGGLFTVAGGQPRRCVAAIDAITGAATSWNPTAGRFVFALAVSGPTVYVGGEVTSMGGLPRRHLAAFDVATGALTGWDPNANSSVNALALSGSTLYVGGAFNNIGGQARNRIAALDVASGAVRAWNPDASGGGVNVNALAVSGSTVYLGGGFTTIGGQSRNKIAAVDSATGAPTSWDPNAGSIPSNSVNAIAVSGSTVYAGGKFFSIGGQSRSCIAALDATTGLATAWDPNVLGVSQVVNTIAVSGSTVYAGGTFNFIGGQNRANIGAVDAVTGAATAWNPVAQSAVNALRPSGRSVYVGGSFFSIGGQTRNAVAALDSTTGLATPWNPNSGNNVVQAAFAVATVGPRTYVGGDFLDLGIFPQGYLASVAAQPSLASLDPATGGNGGMLTLRVSVVAVPSSTAIKLTRSGQPDLPGTAVTTAADGSSLDATFDLSGALPGAWNVVATTPDLQTATLANGFTVQNPTSRQLRVDIVGPALMRPLRPRAFDIVIENPSNNDELTVPLWISRLPLDATVDLDFTVASPPQAGGEPDWSTAPRMFTGPGGAYLALVIPRVPPGVTVRRIYVTVPATVSGFVLDAAVAPPWADGVTFRDCLSRGGISAPACMGGQLTAINAYLAATPSIEALSGPGLWAKVAWQCEGAASLPAALARAEQVLDYMLQPVEHTGTPGGCGVALVPRWQDTLAVTVVTSLDPNVKLGADGHGPARQVGSGQILPYSIRFENAETATAPVQSVVVTDVLDVTRLNVATVSLGPIKFGRRANGKPWTVDPGSGLKSYATDLDLRPEQDLIVRVSANLDEASGVLGWSLVALDPATMELPDDPLVGLLPPNVVPGAGEGSLFFTVTPKTGLTGGAQIKNRATINFDGAATQTPDWSNSIDATPPESAVQPLAATQDSASFTVHWQAVGAQPDLQNYSVYVSKNGGAYQPWRVQTTATADTFSGTGGTYAFYSLAQDSSGNLEPVPTSPDVSTLARLGVEPGGGALALALEGALPNPSTTGALVWFTLPSRERAVLEVMDVAGRRLLRREVGAMGPGRHSVDVSAAARRPGLYFLRLVQGDRVLHARMMAIR